MIIGISGTFGAGKDLVAKYLERKGFEHFSTSDILRQLTLERGRKPERENYRITANELKNEQGGECLAKKAVSQRTKENVIISGIRRAEEIDYLKNQKEKFIMLFIDAPLEVRHARLVERQREGEDKITMDELRNKEELEMSGGSSQRLDLCKERADFIIENDGSIEELNKKIDKILEKN